MFYRIYAVFKGDFYAFGRFDVRGYRIAILFRLVAYGFNRIGGHFYFARNAFFFRVQNPARNHQLDKVYVFGFVVFKNPQRFFGRIGGDCDRTRHVSVRNGNSAIGGKYARADFFAVFDIVAEFSIEIGKPADRSYSGNAA